jgi:predicted nucleic-acid-binding Zn-ribbon protein
MEFNVKSQYKIEFVSLLLLFSILALSSSGYALAAFPCAEGFVAAALNGDLDQKNKQMNRKLIKKHEEILAKVDKNEQLSQEDLQLICDANEIHLNDKDNLNGHHAEAVKLNEWLDKMTELSKDEAMKILEEYLDRDSHTPAKVYRTLHTLWEEATPNDTTGKPTFDNKGKCLKCGSKVSFADVTDVAVLVGDEVIKTYPGDLINRNCVRCSYPERYDDFKHFEEAGEK